jgi:hypothetical protein
MHFECVSAWSAAEEFSPTEEQESYGTIGRGRRMLPSDYADQLSPRTLSTPRYAALSYGLLTPLWRGVMKMRRTERKDPRRKIDKQREYGGRLFPPVSG